MESSKDLFMFSQSIQPKINFHNVEMKRKSKVTTHRKAGENNPLPLSSTLHLQAPWNDYAYKYYYSDSHQNLLLKQITNKVFSEQDLGSKQQLTAINTTEKYKPRTNSRNKGNCNIACCLSELSDIKYTIYYMKHTNVRNMCLLDIRQPLDMVMLALFQTVQTILFSIVASVKKIKIQVPTLPLKDIRKMYKHNKD